MHHKICKGGILGLRLCVGETDDVMARATRRNNFFIAAEDVDLTKKACERSPLL
jgi:hypothetical protein